MKFFFIKTCSNIQVLSTDEQRTLMKLFVSTSLWPLVELGKADSMDMMIKKVGEDIIKKYSQSQALKADLVESAPKSQGHIVNQMLGSGGSAPRPASRSPGVQRKKYDTDTRGRDRTKAPHNNGGGQSPWRSKSCSRECWGCHEVVSGDHYKANCPKQKKKEDQNKSITPYPGRNRSSSRDRSGAF